MSIRIAYPKGELARYVKSYWGLSSSLDHGQEHIQRIVPNGLPELTFHLGDIPEYHSSGSDRHELPGRGLLSGQQQDWFDIRISGKTSLFSVIFQAHALGAFFSIPADQCVNSSVPLEYFDRHGTKILLAQLEEARNFDTQIKIAESYLLKRLRRVHEVENLARIQFIIQRINQAGRMLASEDLAHDAYLSKKQFERNFKNYIGMGPARFQRTVRFQQAIYMRSRNPGYHLTRIAMDSGYYDQAHMIREFRRLSGLAPGTYFSRGEVYSDYF